jgi:hypothetical protein
MITSDASFDINSQQAFNALKTKLSCRTLLSLPNFSKVFRFACDARVIDHVYPFLHWIHKLFVGIVITLIIITFAFVIIKCIHYVRHEEATLKLDNLFANIRTTAN